MSSAATTPTLRRLRPMLGRDPAEPGRASSPLELLFDLTFVVAIGVGAEHFAELLAERQFTSGLLGFGFATFATVWAWINFSWFASAFDTDDWAYRLTTMLQMCGVVVLALGMPSMFASIPNGRHFDSTVIVMGYVVMRVAMVLQWLRAGHQDPERRTVCRTYAGWITLAQLGWLAMACASISFTTTMLVALVLVAVELIGPAFAEQRDPTPWNPHHIADRYAAFAIIALGEGIVGTVASGSGALSGSAGQGTHWTWQAVAIVVAGLSMTFGMWWVYFSVAFGEMLHHRRRSSFWFGYGHMITFAAIAGAGGGLHLAGLYLEHDSALSAVAVVAVIAMSIAAYLVSLFVMFALVIRSRDTFHLLLIAGTCVVLVFAVLLAAAGVTLPVCALVAAAAPWINVVGYETLGHRHQHQMLAELAVDAG